MPVAQEDDSVSYQPITTAILQDKGNITTDGIITVSDGENAVLADVVLGVAEQSISTKQLANQAVTTDKISSELYADNETIQNALQGSILVADGNGGVSYKELKATMPKFFYLPSIYLDVTPGLTGSRNVYDDYSKQFSQPKHANPKAGANAKLPVLPSSALNYYISFLDDDIFEEVSISDQGILNYKVKANAVVTDRSYLNIVLEVRE